MPGLRAALLAFGHREREGERGTRSSSRRSRNRRRTFARRTRRGMVTMSARRRNTPACILSRVHPLLRREPGDSREKDDAYRNGRDRVVRRFRRDERPAAGTDRLRPARRAGDLAPRVPRRHGCVRRRGVRHGRRRPRAAVRPRRGPAHRVRAGRRQHPRHGDGAAGLQLACRRQVGRSDVVGLGPVRPGHARHRRRSGTGVRRQQRRHVAVRCRRPQRPCRQQRVRQPQDHLRRYRYRGAGERG